MARSAALWGLLAVVLSGTNAAADPDTILLQSTTSTQNSGLYEALLTQFEDTTGRDVQVVAVGTGQALKNAQNCDGDILITHDRTAEEAFVAAGYGTARHDLMANDFVLIGPASDPAGIADANTVTDALTALTRAAFLSRGDDSGTHKAELRLWASAGIETSNLPNRLEAGQGMGATLNMAVALGAYSLSDRATWLAFENKGTHAVLFDGDPHLQNPYGLIVLDPDHCPGANHDGAAALRDWLLGPDGQAAIGAFRINGEQVFFPARP